ncbi:hypothetical protein ES703_88536 [subsurface metagenome]
MYNVPYYKTNEFSFGPGILYAGAVGTTPTIDNTHDIGGVRSGASFVITRTMLDVMQGSPATLVKRYVTAETGVLTVTGIQWNFPNFANALGTSNISETDFEFGGSMEVEDVALQFVHKSPAGYCHVLMLYLANGQGTLTIPFGDDLHEFEYAFSALATASDWRGNTLAAGKQLFKITRTAVG